MTSGNGLLLSANHLSIIHKLGDQLSFKSSFPKRGPTHKEHVKESCSVKNYVQYLQVQQISYFSFFIFPVISIIYRSFIPNKTASKYWLIQWSFKIYWMRQYVVNFTCLTCTVNVAVYKANFRLGHGKLSQFLTFECIIASKWDDVLTMICTTKLLCGTVHPCP